MRRILPHPLLSLSVLIMWLLLSGFTVGQFLLGVLVAIFAGRLMVLLQPEKIIVKSWAPIFILVYRVLVDITVSNIAVARIIVSGGRKKHSSGFIIVPLELKNRAGLGFLVCIMTATPGTAWISYNSKNNEVLVHVLDLDDEDYWKNLIKIRYESLLVEIFQ